MAAETGDQPPAYRILRSLRVVVIVMQGFYLSFQDSAWKLKLCVQTPLNHWSLFSNWWMPLVWDTHRIHSIQSPSSCSLFLTNDKCWEQCGWWNPSFSSTVFHHCLFLADTIMAKWCTIFLLFAQWLFCQRQFSIGWWWWQQTVLRSSQENTGSGFKVLLQRCSFSDTNDMWQVSTCLCF